MYSPSLCNALDLLVRKGVSSQSPLANHSKTSRNSKDRLRLFFTSFFAFTFISVLLSQLFFDSERVHTLSQSISRSFRSTSLLPPPNHGEKGWCSFVVMCGTGDTDTVSEMRPLLVSAILLSTCPLHFIFMTDEEGADRMQDMFLNNLTIADKPIRVDVWTLSTDWIDEQALKIKLDPHGHHSGSWGTAKLFVPWLLPELERVIVMDSDMIFLDDPASLWAQFEDEETWAYKMPLFDRSSSTKICSCVVLINIPKAHHARAYPKLFAQELNRHPKWQNERSSLYIPPQGDQGIYFGMMQSHPELLVSLDDRFNVDHCHGYYGAMKNSSSKMVSVLHKNCDNVRSSLEAEADVFFDYYWAYKWSWLRGSNETGYPVELNRYTRNSSSTFTAS